MTIVRVVVRIKIGGSLFWNILLKKKTRTDGSP
jgi:hypothetical protein